MCLIQNVHEFTKNESSATQDPSNLKVNIFYLASVFRSPEAKNSMLSDSIYVEYMEQSLLQMSNRFIRNKSRWRLLGVQQSMVTFITAST